MCVLTIQLISTEFYTERKLSQSFTQDFHVKMESLQQRREELERKEQQLKDSLLKFDKFLKVLQFCVFTILSPGMGGFLVSVIVECTS